jgi:hypothetical protein
MMTMRDPAEQNAFAMVEEVCGGKESEGFEERRDTF